MIDIRYMKKDGKRRLRLRDDCRGFDPVAYRQAGGEKSEGEKDFISHIGIRMVMGMVKDANDINSLGLNNLTLIL